jgi:hypothetical protein
MDIGPERHTQDCEVIAEVAWIGVPPIEVPVADQRVADDGRPWIVAQVQTAGQDEGRIVVEVSAEPLELGGEADEQSQIEMLSCVLAASPLAGDAPVDRFEAVEGRAATSFSNLQGV